MQKHIEPIVTMLSGLIDVLKEQNADYGEFLLAKKNPRPGMEERYAEKIANNKRKINYLSSLKDALEKPQSEASMPDLLDKVEKIDVKVSTIMHKPRQVLQKKRPEVNVRVPLASYKKIAPYLKSISENREAIMQALREERSNRERAISGRPDKTGQIKSPGITDFVVEVTTSSLEKIDEHQPPALNDFTRDDFVNGARLALPEERNKQAEALRRALTEFLSESPSIAEDASMMAAHSNTMLNNGQTLQKVFTNEISREENTAFATQQNEPLVYALGGKSTFNWYLNEDGQLSVDLSLEVKGVTNQSLDRIAQVADKETGKLREYVPYSPRTRAGDDLNECPTLVSYQATVVFETKEVKHSDEEKEDKEILAVPRIARYEVKVYSDQIHYTPTLTNFTEKHSVKAAAEVPNIAAHK